jgi:protein CpxP
MKTRRKMLLRLRFNDEALIERRSRVDMKKMKFGVAALALSLLAFGLIAGSTQAQSFKRGAVAAQGEGSGNTAIAKQHGRRGGMTGMFFRGLDLTDAQKEQIKSINEQARTSSAPFREQLKPFRDQMRALVESGNFNESNARAIAAQQSQIEAELAVIRARTEAAVYNVLTPEQKTKLAELRQNRRGPRGDKGGIR